MHAVSGAGNHLDLERGSCIIDHYDLVEGRQRHDLSGDDQVGQLIEVLGGMNGPNLGKAVQLDGERGLGEKWGLYSEAGWGGHDLS
jgi:hypothetical protein